MNITEAQKVNTVLRWLLEAPRPTGAVPTHEQGRDAAAWLADRAGTALYAGLSGDDVRERWHWRDDGEPAPTRTGTPL